MTKCVDFQKFFFDSFRQNLMLVKIKQISCLSITSFHLFAIFFFFHVINVIPPERFFAETLKKILETDFFSNFILKYCACVDAIKFDDVRHFMHFFTLSHFTFLISQKLNMKKLYDFMNFSFCRLILEKK